MCASSARCAACRPSWRSGRLSTSPRARHRSSGRPFTCPRAPRRGSMPAGSRSRPGTESRPACRCWSGSSRCACPLPTRDTASGGAWIGGGTATTPASPALRRIRSASSSSSCGSTAATWSPTTACRRKRGTTRSPLTSGRITGASICPSPISWPLDARRGSSPRRSPSNTWALRTFSATCRRSSEWTAPLPPSARSCARLTARWTIG
jgi:hypothetical protein